MHNLRTQGGKAATPRVALRRSPMGGSCLGGSGLVGFVTRGAAAAARRWAPRVAVVAVVAVVVAVAAATVVAAATLLVVPTLLVEPVALVVAVAVVVVTSAC